MVDNLRKISIKYPFIATIIIVLLVELVFHIKMFEYIIPDTLQLGGTIDRVLYSIIWMFFIIFFMKNNLKEIGYSTKNLKEGLKIGKWVLLIPLFAYVSPFISNVIAGNGHFISSPKEIFNLIDYLLLFISVGLFEETVYRAIPINILRNKKDLNERKTMLYCVVISSILFGLVHLINMIGGFDTPSQAIGRAISCIGTGMIFGAIYYRTGSLLSVIIIHAIWDSCSVLSECIYIVDEAITSTSTVTTSFISAIIYGTIMAGVNIWIALHIMRKEKCKKCAIEAPTMRENISF